MNTEFTNKTLFNNFTVKLKASITLIVTILLSNLLNAQGSTCATATVVTPGTYTANTLSGSGATNAGATAAAWYSFTPPASGYININSCSGGSDTRLWISTGACGAQTNFASNDDFMGCISVGTDNYASRIENLSLTSGVTYYFQWDNRWDNTAFTWSFTFTYAIVISSSTQTNISCNGANDGAASVTTAFGVAPISYNWTPGNPVGDGTASVTGLTPGTWTCTVTDGNGATATQNFTITEPTALTGNATATSLLCNGDESTITVTAAGGTAPYTGTGTFTANAGNQSYTITDNNGCSTSASVIVTEPDALIADAIATPILCNGDESTVTVSVTGGTAPYSGIGTFTANAGNQTYTITDDNGCTTSALVNITEPDALTADAIATPILCNGDESTVTVSATGGTTPYSGIGTFTANAGNQTYTITDDNGCTTSALVNITEPDALSLNIVASDTVICLGNSSTLIANGNGGTGILTYEWVAGPTSNSYNVSPTSTSTFTVNLTDENLCSQTESVDVTVNSLPVLSVVTSDTLICVGETATLTASGASSYSWNTGETTLSITISPTLTTLFTVTGIDTNGCSNSSAFTQEVSMCAGIESFNSTNNDILVYPNPTKAVVTVALNSSAKAEILDVLGKVIYTQDLKAGKNTIDLSDFNTGVYFLSLDNNGSLYTTKIIKE
jgi:hypothetical protein